MIEIKLPLLALALKLYQARLDAGDGAAKARNEVADVVGERIAHVVQGTVEALRESGRSLDSYIARLSPGEVITPPRIPRAKPRSAGVVMIDTEE